MFFFKQALLFLASAALLEALEQRSPRFVRGRFFRDFCLDRDVVQLASALTGQEPETVGVKDGQTESTPDRANFIKFCDGKTITNGTQVQEGSCNPIPMGEIPAVTNMVSAIITNPKFGQTLDKNESFTVTVQTAHLDAGKFTNPTTTYYSAPQQLNEAGDIIGHCHVTIQDLGDIDTQTPPDAQQKVFFLGIDDAGNGQGLLSADVTLGLNPGNYRVCTLMGAMNHQPVSMPIAQRGAQDDCVRFKVVDKSLGNSTAPAVRRFTFPRPHQL